MRVASRPAGVRSSTRSRPVPRPVPLTVASGVAVIAVAFGLARYGYGLLLPDIRADLGFDTTTAGMISSGAYVSYLVANTVVVPLTARTGPRVPIAVAMATAGGGMALIATSTSTTQFAVGVLVAGLSAGFAFPPYGDIASASIPEDRRNLAWAAISSGTGWGVLVAGPVAIVSGTSWRSVWWLFAGVALFVGVVATWAAPARIRSSAQLPSLRPSWFFRDRSRPLLGSAILIGFGSSVWWAFSVDALRAAGTEPDTARVIYALCGAAGIAGLFAGPAVSVLGQRTVHCVSVIGVSASLVALATAPAAAAGALTALLFGVTYNSVIAVQGLWSADVFADRPSAGLAAVSTGLTVGTLTGPATAGLVIGWFGYPAALALAALICIAAVFTAPSRRRGPAAG